MNRLFPLVLVGNLLFNFAASTIAYAQQYMKTANGVTDAKFEGWISANKLVKCRAVPHTAYPDGPKEIMDLSPKPSGVCYWDIDRAAELAPPPLAVHAGTRVFVRLKHPRPNEIIVPAVVFAKIVPPSPGNDVLKNAVNPLQALTVSPAVVNHFLIVSASDCDPTSATFNIAECQKHMIDETNSIQGSINRANSALTCLENYQVSKPPTFTCSTANMIDPDAPASKTESFAFQQKQARDLLNAAINLKPPVASFTQLDTYLTAHMGTYPGQLATDGLIKNAIGAVQSAQATLDQSLVLLEAMPTTANSQFYYFDVPRLASATATITGTEIISKTNSTIATWATTSTVYPLVFSAGLGFSNLVGRSFSNTPQFQNGMPVLNSSGNVVSVVTETDTGMSVMAPEVLGSYLLPWRTLNSKCSIGCSLLVSGGIGANLTTKSADFDTGISLRLWDFLLTPAVHWGRETRLIDGIAVGSQLGANAPSALPTQNKWVKKFGFVFTYVIPLT